MIVWTIWFRLGNLPPRDLDLFCLTFHVSVILCSSSVVSMPLKFKAHQGCGDLLFYPFEALSNFHFLRYRRFVKCQNIGMHIISSLLLSTLSSSYPFVTCIPCFPNSVLIFSGLTKAWRSSCGVMTKVLDCSLEVSEFELLSYYCVLFRSNGTLEKGMKSLIYPVRS